MPILTPRGGSGTFFLQPLLLKCPDMLCIKTESNILVKYLASITNICCNIKLVEGSFMPRNFKELPKAGICQIFQVGLQQNTVSLALAYHEYKAILTELKLFILEKNTVQLSDSRTNMHNERSLTMRRELKKKV